MTRNNRRCPACYGHHGRRCPTPVRTWPLAPLLAAARCTESTLCHRLGIGATAMRAARLDGISDNQADRWAIRCGLHPEQVWPGWCEAALTVLDDLHVNGGGWRQAWLWEREHADVEREVA